MTEKFINLEVAIKLLEHHGLSNGGALGHHSGKCDLAAELLRSTPAANVVEVRHGRWQNPEDVECYQCSVCGKYRNQEHGLNVPIFDKFCPNCGAKMDGGQDE